MTKKICFLTVRNIFTISCLPRYREIIGSNSFDIIYWDRHDIVEECGAENYYPMKYLVTSEDSKLRKLRGYLKFVQFAKKLIKEKNYDILILLPTQTGILFKSIAKKSFNGNYLIDIRDYTMENNKLYYKMVEDLIKNSGLTVITSPAYRNFLPQHDYLISHNITKIPNTWIKEFRELETHNNSIVISCIGGIRFFEQFKRVISCFANDDRFFLKFIGNGSECLRDYCFHNKILNVELIGRFSENKTLDYYKGTNIVMNLYGNNSPFLDYALSNKLYYAATIGIPILVCPNTYMEKISVDNGFGFVFDLDNESILDQLYEYYHSIDWNTFYQNCDQFIKNVYKDELEFIRRVENFINS